MLAITGIAIATQVGIPVATSITIKSLHGLFDLVNGTVKNLTSHNHIPLNNIMEDLDIKARFDTLNALLKDLEKKHLESESISIALHNLHDIMTRVHNELDSIDKIVKDHSLKWFSSWRSLNYTSNISRLERLIKIMDSRSALLIELLKINL